MPDEEVVNTAAQPAEPPAAPPAEVPPAEPQTATPEPPPQTETSISETVPPPSEPAPAVAQPIAEPTPTPALAVQPVPSAPPVVPPPATPVPQQAPATSPKSFLARAIEAIQFRKRAKLEKIVALASARGSITNDDVEKLVRVSHATATRYLVQLVAEGRLERVSSRGGARYVPANNSNGGN